MKKIRQAGAYIFKKCGDQDRRRTPTGSSSQVYQSNLFGLTPTGSNIDIDILAQFGFYSEQSSSSLTGSAQEDNQGIAQLSGHAVVDDKLDTNCSPECPPVPTLPAGSVRERNSVPVPCIGRLGKRAQNERERRVCGHRLGVTVRTS